MKGKLVYSTPTAKIERISTEDILTLSQSPVDEVGNVTPIIWKGDE